MESPPQRLRKRHRFGALFRFKDQTPPSSAPVSPPANPPPSAIPESADRQRTKARYTEAAKLLEEVVKGRESQWGKFEFPELTGEPEDFNVSLFKDNINSILEKRRGAVKDDTAWGKCEHAIQCVFTAFSPFAKNFLGIAKEGQAVLSFSVSLIEIDSGTESVWTHLWRPSSIDNCISLIFFSWLLTIHRSRRKKSEDGQTSGGIWIICVNNSNNSQS